METTEKDFEVWTRSCSVIDTTGGERAVMLAMCIPLEGTDLKWHDDPQVSRNVAASTQPYINPTRTKCGVEGAASLYPMAVISRGDRALVIAVPVEPARIVRFVYDSWAKELRAEFDFGLSPVPTKFPSRADATVIAYEVPAKWAFRQALAKILFALSRAFVRRKGTPAGTWLPFGDIRPIEHPEDFGIACHECADQQLVGDDGKAFLAADEKAGAQTYPYVEPPTYWHDFKGDKKRDTGRGLSS
jgi:hypothetical protein